MGRLRITGAALALLVALVAAGCGGGGGGGGQASADGAGSAPAGAAAFISINSDTTSQQWKQLEKLLNKFPGRDQLTQGLRDSLQREGVDYEKDVKPAVGDEVDVVWLDFRGSGNNFVALTQPKDEQKFDRLMRKGNSRTYSAKVGDWTAFAQSQTALSTYRERVKGDKLAGDKTFKDAMDQVSGDALVKAYVNGPAISTAFQNVSAAVGGEGATPVPFGLDKLQYIVIQGKSEDEGMRIEGAFKSSDGRPLGTTASFKSKLISGVPEGALAFLTFRGDTIRNQIADLRKLPQFEQGIQQFERSLGIQLDTVLGLLQHEVALYVRPGAPIPEISIALEAPNEQQAMSVLDRLAARAARLGGGRLSSAQEDGTTVKTITFRNFAVHYATFDGRALVTSGPSGIRDYRAGGGKLEDDSVYKNATDAAGLPGETSGMLYVNLKDGIPLVENFATTAGQALPRQVAENLAPLRSFVAYGTGEQSLTKFTAFLEIK